MGLDKQIITVTVLLLLSVTNKIQENVARSL